MERKCRIKDCNQRHSGRNLCREHYFRAQHDGLLDVVTPILAALEEGESFDYAAYFASEVIRYNRDWKPEEPPVEPERIEEARQWFGIDYFYLEKLLTTHHNNVAWAKAITDRTAK